MIRRFNYPDPGPVRPVGYTCGMYAAFAAADEEQTVSALTSRAHDEDWLSLYVKSEERVESRAQEAESVAARLVL